jgi:hypothetical protein
VRKQCHFMQAMLQDHVTFLFRIIEMHGSVSIGKHRALSEAEVVHDFIYFCLTKAARSLCAADQLLTSGFFEDAKILARSIYECYLNGAFARVNPSRIDELVDAKVGIYAGDYQHPKSNKGVTLQHKMIHPQTQEVVPYGISFVELSAKTGIPTDEAVHNKLYGFLSEFSHVHMIASGSYRVKTDSIYDPAPAPYGIYHTIFLCTYCSWLMAHLAAMMPGTAGLLVEVRKDAKFLISALADIEFSEKMEDLKIKLKSRLSNA